MISFLKVGSMVQQYQLTLAGVGVGGWLTCRISTPIPHLPLHPQSDESKSVFEQELGDNAGWNLRSTALDFGFKQWFQHIPKEGWAWGRRGHLHSCCNHRLSSLGFYLNFGLKKMKESSKKFENHLPTLILPMKKQRPREAMELANTQDTFMRVRIRIQTPWPWA